MFYVVRDSNNILRVVRSNVAPPDVLAVPPMASPDRPERAEWLVLNRDPSKPFGNRADVDQTLKDLILAQEASAEQSKNDFESQVNAIRGQLRTAIGTIDTADLATMRTVLKRLLRLVLRDLS